MRATKGLVLLVVLAGLCNAHAEDTTRVPHVRGGIYDRPYLFRPSARVAIGGYAEAMMRTEYTDGVFENLSFEARRFNIFLFSSVSDLIKVTAELEFEHGTEEIKLETAIADIQFFEEVNFRAGILLSPLGKFNLAHDSPRNEFTDRPLVSTQIIPSTFSEAGLGVYGTFFLPSSVAGRLTYESYLVNGLNDDVILGGDGTSIPAGRPSAFEEDNNGSPAFVGRLAWVPGFGGELGVSLHTGLYNTHSVEGLTIDERRRLSIVAIDAEYAIGPLNLRGEFAHARINVPSSLIGFYAERQAGVYGEAVCEVFSHVLPMFPRSTLAIGARYDMIDLDTDIIGADTHRLTVGLNLRPVPETAIKLDYQHNWIFDRINNESRTAVMQFGVATYF